MTVEVGNGGDGSLAERLVNSALGFRSQAPLVDSLLTEIGLDGLKGSVPFFPTDQISMDLRRISRPLVLQCTGAGHSQKTRSQPRNGRRCQYP